MKDFSMKLKHRSTDLVLWYYHKINNRTFTLNPLSYYTYARTFSPSILSWMSILLSVSISMTMYA